MINAPKIGWGPKPLQDYLDELAAYIDSIKPVAGIGTAVYDVPGGRAINAGPSGAAGSEAETHPFQLVDASEEGSVNIRVIYGTVAGSAPTGMSVGDDPPYILTGLGSSGKIWLGITRNTGTDAITSRFIDSGSALPSPSASAGYLEIGSWSVSGDDVNIAQAISGSQAYQYCGGHLWGLV